MNTSRARCVAGRLGVPVGVQLQRDAARGGAALPARGDTHAGARSDWSAAAVQMGICSTSTATRRGQQHSVECAVRAARLERHFHFSAVHICGRAAVQRRRRSIVGDSRVRFIQLGGLL